MGQLIDTSVIIGMERRGMHPRDLAGVGAAREAAALAAITASELLLGVHRAGGEARRLRRETFVETTLAALPVIPFDLQVARVHSGLWAKLLALGQRIGEYDLLIAATALTHGYSVLTDNTREFRRVPGLVVHQSQWPTG